METSLIIGVAATVLLLAGWIVASAMLHRRQRAMGDAAPFASADRRAVERGQSLHDQATAAQMSAMASAQRQ
ncbi:MAG: hypothetical protein ACTHMQ_07725 [Protaetiibacter sp.]